MQAHTDTTSPIVSREFHREFIGNYVVILVLSQRGIDYTTGGTYLVFEDKQILIDDDFRPGDLLIYDQNTQHGVLGVDPNKPLDFRSLRGRLVALSTLYPY